MLVNAYVIYDGTTSTYNGDTGTQISINCERLQAFSPRPVWLLRRLFPGDGTTIEYVVTFAPTSVELLDANTLSGFWIEQDDKDVMVDVTTLSAFQAACDACCGTVPTIIANQYGGFAPAFTPLTLNSFCIQRLDAGTINAIEQASLDYSNQILGDSLVVKSHITGVSHYSVSTFNATVVARGSDVVTAGLCAN